MNTDNRAAYTIREFCAAHGISQAIFYEMKRDGLGPREMRIGHTGVRISLEAAADWRRHMEERAATASSKTETA